FIGEYSATIAGSKGRKRSPRLSVPSSSGNTLQHRLLASQIAMSLFQSPLHRGILCNGYSAGGKALESAAFSPLFIGEYSATRADRWPTSSSCSSLSVPSSSGNTLQRQRTREKQGTELAFSPLFIGEYSATAQKQAETMRRLAAFSPLFIGEYSATAPTLLPG